MIDIKTAKLRLLQMHYEAGIGHIGGNLSCMEILWALYGKILTPADDLIISKGHAAGAHYITLWATGVLVDNDLKLFHKDGGLPGHIAGTGSLGHGLSKAAGIALHKQLWNKPGIVYCLTSDGEWDEGSTWEALEFIASNQLYNHMKIIVDCNGLKGFTEAQHYRLLRDKMLAYMGGVAVPTVGRHELNFDGVSNIYLVQTTKGNGVSFLENQLASHYEPLTKEQYELACEEIRNA